MLEEREFTGSPVTPIASVERRPSTGDEDNTVQIGDTSEAGTMGQSQKATDEDSGVILKQNGTTRIEVKTSNEERLRTEYKVALANALIGVKQAFSAVLEELNVQAEDPRLEAVIHDFASRIARTALQNKKPGVVFWFVDMNAIRTTVSEVLGIEIMDADTETEGAKTH